MVLFLDSNVIFDAVLERLQFNEEAEKILALNNKAGFEIIISSLTIPNFHYVARKFYNEVTLRKMILIIDSQCKTVPLTIEIIRIALDAGFSDFEDAVQYISARNAKADYIITRNQKDFKKSEIPVLTPTQFLAKLDR